MEDSRTPAVPGLEGGPTAFSRARLIRDFGSPPAEGDDLFCLASVVDVDDFVVRRLSRGDAWAVGLIARIERLLSDEQQRIAPAASLFHLEPDEWIILLHSSEPRELRAIGIELANNLREQVEDQTTVTITVSLGSVQEGHYRTERSIADAVGANQRKLVLGGNRVIISDDEAVQPSDQLSPQRIEHELARRIREGDREGAVELIKNWIAASASLNGVTPEVLRSWVAAAILFSLDVAGHRRLSDGSMDWVEVFGSTQPSFDELISLSTIHEQSYLGVWLEQVIPSSVHKDREPTSSKRQILALVEAYLQEHYAEELSLSKVSRALYVSSFYVSHLFNRELNTTFLKYLTAIRMAKARQLLLETDEPIASIAEQVGYATPKNFRCVFKRAVGVTPTEYRRSSTQNA